jgi:hypothetical protein
MHVPTDEQNIFDSADQFLNEFKMTGICNFNTDDLKRFVNVYR